MPTLVTAVIKPFALGRVQAALTDVGVEGLTVTEVRGAGRQGGHTETYRGAEYTLDLVPKVQVEVLTTDAAAATVAAAIAQAANTGKIGDGKIWVTQVQDVVRIRTGEKDDDAL
jgi:nitrogen regulatory protein P-II 1